MRLDEGGCAAQQQLSLGVPPLFCVKGLVMSEGGPLEGGRGRRGTEGGEEWMRTLPDTGLLKDMREDTR